MNQKLENLLNLALQTPEETRIKSDILNVGFDSVMRTWELIVKYHGSLKELEQFKIRIEYLIAGYAILTVPELLVEYVAEIEQIEYVEKPKRFYYSVSYGKADSCVYPLTRREPNLDGSGCLIAILDSGIDYQRMDFRHPDGTTRIKYLWDQTLTPDEVGAPEGYAIGVEFSSADINAALQAETKLQGYLMVPSRDTNGHGTAIAGIAAGNGGEFGATYSGVATQSSLLIVKLGLLNESGFPRTTEVMRAVAYAVNKGVELQMPLVINLSFGNTYGSHDGSSLLERFLNNASEIGRTVICVGSGNEGDSAGHVAGNVAETSVTELAVGEYEPTTNVQIWKNYSDEYQLRLVSPGGLSQELPQYIKNGKYSIKMEQTEILVYIGEPAPYSVAQEIFLDMIPYGRNYINSGIWQIIMEPIKIVTGQFYLYLPGQAARNERTRFYSPNPQVTLTIPSTAAKIITVGAYDSQNNAYAEFSGRGYVDERRTIGVLTAGLTKPDLAAPGVGIVAPNVYGGFEPVTGTSFATPFVAGSAALMMQWGIVMGNDIFLYGEKVKAYLRSGAKPIRGEENYPNDRVGAYDNIVSS